MPMLTAPLPFKEGDPYMNYTLHIPQVVLLTPNFFSSRISITEFA